MVLQTILLLPSENFGDPGSEWLLRTGLVHGLCMRGVTFSPAIFATECYTLEYVF